jgi:hypothetical protein
LWFVFDPNPHAVWNEFVVGENANKFDAQQGSYLATLLWGGSSIWALIIAYPMNAGLLAFPVASLFFIAYQRRFIIAEDESMLWIWMAALFIVFCLPNQRTARYLLEAMPAVAVLCALYWQRLPRWAFTVSLLFAAIWVALLTYLAVRLQQEVGGLYGLGFGLLVIALIALIGAGLLSAHYARASLSGIAILAMLLLAVFLRPFDGVLGNFSPEAQRYVQNKTVWTPCNFRAVDEGYRFLLPGAQVHGYLAVPQPKFEALASQYNIFAVQLPLQEKCVGCKVIGQRLEIRNRHSSDEIKRIFQGEVYQQLFVNEWLIEAPNAKLAAVLVEGCR